MAGRSITTKCTNWLLPGSLQAVFGCHISHAKSGHDLDFLAWMETLRCFVTAASGNAGS